MWKSLFFLYRYFLKHFSKSKNKLFFYHKNMFDQNFKVNFFWIFLHLKKSLLLCLETWDLKCRHPLEIFMIFDSVSNISPRVFNQFYLYELFEHSSVNYTWITYRNEISWKLWEKSCKNHQTILNDKNCWRWHTYVTVMNLSIHILEKGNCVPPFYIYICFLIVK